MTTREERIHTVKDFLSRPIIISTGLWSSATTSETQLYTANFPEVLIANSMYQEKLRGFVGLRATLVIKVQVNSQPFQQGRLMLQYIPYAQYMPNRVALINSTLQGRSGCPRTDLDLSVGTEIEMRIPYVSPHVYYNLVTGQGSFGAIYLVVYSQLRDQITGTGAVEYTIWAHLEDVDVQYPTGANIFTGSAPNFSSVGQQILEGKFTESDMRTLWNNKAYKKHPDKIFAQVASELKQLKDNASPSVGIGQISEGLSTLSKIPVLGNMFTKPAWISAQASNIFKMLGFSKPSVAGLPCESKLRGQARMANFDGADTSHKLALSSQNEIETKSGLSGTSADEMNLSHITSIPNFWDTFTWNTTDLTGTTLWNNYVTPMKIKPYSDEITDRFRCTHMGFVANSHGYWRGSIVYTFKFVKTKFHSGRLQISFIPFYFNSTISTGVPDVSRTQKIIVDLKTSTEVSFTVPYVSSRPWMFCIRPESSWLGENGTNMFNAVSGIVRVEVLNQLVAANSVYQSMQTLVEVSGGPDLTFASPTCPSYVPYGGTFTALATSVKNEQKQEEYNNEVGPRVIDAGTGKIYTQIMGENEAVPRNEAQHGIHPMTIDTHMIDSNWSPEAHCIGEKIMSIRQLIKRFGAVHAGEIILNNSSVATSLILAPFSQMIPPTSIASTRQMPLLDYYYYLYAFWRGSMRYKLYSETSPTATGSRTKSNFPWIVSMFSSIQDSMNQLVPLFSATVNQVASAILPIGVLYSQPSRIVVDTQVEGLVEFEVPYYNISHISPATQFNATNRAANINDMLRGHTPPVVVTMRPSSVPSTSNVITTSLYKAAGDDFSLMYLVGVPPLVNLIRT
jgi:hypothetical protein